MPVHPVERKLAAIAKLKVQEGYFSAPKIRALVETTISTGLRKAGCPRNNRRHPISTA